MNRRGFLRALGIGVTALAAAPVLAFVPDPKPLEVTFHSDAFALSTPEFQDRFVRPAAKALADKIDADSLGISLRMVRDYDIETDRFPSKIDVLYGSVVLNPSFAVRVAA